jgi:hypothetical protein
MTSSSRPISTSTLTSACAWPHADRAIFLRICEDRGIESYAWLQSLLNGERVYARLLKHFRDADDKYNSGLFCFSERRAEQPAKTGTVPQRVRRSCSEGLSPVFAEATERVPSGFTEPPDRLSLELNIDDKPLKDIIGNLYYPDSPYEFSVMPADMLGEPPIARDKPPTKPASRRNREP